MNPSMPPYEATAEADVFRLLNEYAWAHDILDADATAACFLVNGKFTSTLPDGTVFGPISGRDTIREFYRQIFEDMKPGEIRRHYVTNAVVQPVDGHILAVRSYVIVTSSRNGVPALYTLGWQQDLVSCQDGVALFAEKNLRLDSITTVPGPVTEPH